ncbi:MAG: hypothetical protein WD355_10675 [Balneolaceae bacterium]
MKRILSQTGLLGVVSVFLLTGCYSQLQTVHYYDGYGPATEKDRSEQNAQARQEIREEDRTLSADPEESYLYGYDDGLDEGYTEGWGDAELYYFKDYETARWFREQGFTLSVGKKFANYYNYHHFSGFYPYSARYWYGHNLYSPGWRINFRFGNWYHMNYSHWHHYDLAWYGHPYGWNYYRYPFYDPYYYGYPYYGSTYVFNNNYYGFTPSGQGRQNTIRSSGLSNNSDLNRNRSRERVQSAGSGVVTGARSAGVSSTPQQRTRVESGQGTVGRTSGSAVRNSGSAERSRVEERNDATRVQRSRLSYPASNSNSATLSIQNRIHTESVGRETGLRAPVQNVNRPSGWARFGQMLLESQSFTGPASRSRVSVPSSRSSGGSYVNPGSSSGRSSSAGSSSVRSSSGSSNGSSGTRSSGSSSNNRSRGN